MTTPSGAPRWCIGCRIRRPCPRRVPRVMRSLRSAAAPGASGAYRNGTKERTAKRHRPAGRSRQQARSGPEVCEGGQGSRSTPAPAENKIPRQAARERAAGALQHLAARRPHALPPDAGGHGAEFAGIATELTLVDPKAKVKQLSRKQTSFKYRSSNIEGIVLEAKVGLGEESPAKLKDLQSKLLRWRKAGTPFDQPCCGSTFTNPPGGTKTAGMLIDECGLKGFTIGGAQGSTLHANYIINKGTATASEGRKLIEHVRKTVAKKTGITLELECKIIGP